MAAVGGMPKDASADDDCGWSVESPIFDYAYFERLENEERQEFGGQNLRSSVETPDSAIRLTQATQHDRIVGTGDSLPDR